MADEVELKNYSAIACTKGLSLDFTLYRSDHLHLTDGYRYVEEYSHSEAIHHATNSIRSDIN